jgi:hypothetical protein
MTNWRPTTRLRPRPWREPRLVLGVLLVLGATVLGGRLAAAGDDRVEYWAVRSPVTAGDAVAEDVLEPTRVRLSEAAAANYVRADEEFDAPLEELVWAHALSSGSLVEKTSLVPRAGRSHGELPLNVAEGAAPGDLARGDLVDVWVGPGPGDDAAGETVKVLEAVKVLQTGDEASAVGGSLAQTVLVEVDERRLDTSVVGTVASGHVTLVRVS